MKRHSRAFLRLVFPVASMVSLAGVGPVLGEGAAVSTLVSASGGTTCHHAKVTRTTKSHFSPVSLDKIRSINRPLQDQASPSD